MVELNGHVASGFEGVADAFLANFAGDFEVGASVAVVHNGEMVVEAGAPGRFDRARALELGLCAGDSPGNLDQLLLRYKLAKDSLAVFARAEGPVVQINLRGEISGAMREKWTMAPVMPRLTA